MSFKGLKLISKLHKKFNDIFYFISTAVWVVTACILLEVVMTENVALLTLTLDWLLLEDICAFPMSAYDRGCFTLS